MKIYDENKSFEYLYNHINEVIEQTENHKEICWEAKEGSLLEVVSDAVLVDWDGERSVENQTVFYKVVK